MAVNKPDLNEFIPTQNLSGYNADKLAEILEYNLTKSANFNLPDIDLNDKDFKFPKELLDALKTPPKKIEPESFTTGSVDGTGMFDKLMKGFVAQIEYIHNKGRITPTEYAKLFGMAAQLATTSSVELLTKGAEAYWQAILAAVQANKGLLDYYSAQAALAMAKMNAYNAKAQYASTKLNLSTLDANHMNTKEQMESARAATLDTRTDGAYVTGTAGKQKDLYSQQIESYKANDNTNFAKLLSDGFAVIKTADEDALPPDLLTKDSLDDRFEQVVKKLGYR